MVIPSKYCFICCPQFLLLLLVWIGSSEVITGQRLRFDSRNFAEKLPAPLVEVWQLGRTKLSDSPDGKQLDTILFQIEEYLAEPDISPRLRVFCLAVYGQLLIRGSRLSAAYTYCREANELARQRLPPDDLVRGYAQAAYGVYLDFYQSPELAVQPLQESISGIQQLDTTDILHYRKVYWTTIRVEIELGLLKEADEHHNHNVGLLTARKDTTWLARYHNLYGYWLQESGYHQAAIAAFDRGIALFSNPTKEEHRIWYVNLLESIAHSLIAENQFEAGGTNLEQAYFIRMKYGRTNWGLQAMGYLIEYLMAEGQHDRAYRFFQQQADDVAKVKNITARNSNWYRQMGILLKALNQPERAAEYTAIYNSFAAEKLLPSAQRKLDAPNALSEHILLQQRAQAQRELIDQLEIEQLRKEVQLRQYGIALLGLSLGILVLVALTYRWYRRRVEQEHQRAELDRRRILELENDNLKFSVLSQERDIKRLAADNRLRTSIKRDILKRLDKIYRLPGDDQESHLSKLRRELAVTIEDQEAVSVLQDQVETINTAFEERLRARIPGITGQEIRYCSLLRLGMNTQQIAQLLNKSDITVRSYKYRINKKAGLQGKNALQQLVEQL